jgi:hypothetical protein
MKTTKKLLAASSMKKGRWTVGEFLIVDHKTPHTFVGLTSKKPIEHGIVVYLGRDLGVDSVFSGMIDNKHTIHDVDATMRVLDAYFEAIQSFKIGNVLSIDTSKSHLSFHLVSPFPFSSPDTRPDLQG